MSASDVSPETLRNMALEMRRLGEQKGEAELLEALADAREADARTIAEFTWICLRSVGACRICS